MLEKKLHEELKRFKSINKYANKLVFEQEVPPPTGEEIPPVPDEPVEPTASTPTTNDTLPPVPDEPVNDVGMEPQNNTEELDITDLVNMTKSIKGQIDVNGNNQKILDKVVDDVFSKLNDIDQKISQMDMVISKIEQLDNKINNIKEKTPEEKLEMRSLDSYPFNQNPQEFFTSKKDQMRASGKNEYVLTKNDVQNYSTDQIKQSFNPNLNDEFKY